MHALGSSESLCLSSHELVVLGRSLLVALSVTNDRDETSVDEELSDVSDVDATSGPVLARERVENAPAIESLDRSALASLVISFCGLDVVDENVNLRRRSYQYMGATKLSPTVHPCQ